MILRGSSSEGNGSQKPAFIRGEAMPCRSVFTTAIDCRPAFLFIQQARSNSPCACVDADADLTMCRNSNDQYRSCVVLGYRAISSHRTWSPISRHGGQNWSGANTRPTSACYRQRGIEPRCQLVTAPHYSPPGLASMRIWTPPGLQATDVFGVEYECTRISGLF